MFLKNIFTFFLQSLFPFFHGEKVQKVVLCVFIARAHFYKLALIVLKLYLVGVMSAATTLHSQLDIENGFIFSHRLWVFCF